MLYWYWRGQIILTSFFFFFLNMDGGNFSLNPENYNWTTQKWMPYWKLKTQWCFCCYLQTVAYTLGHKGWVGEKNNVVYGGWSLWRCRRQMCVNVWTVPAECRTAVNTVACRSQGTEGVPEPSAGVGRRQVYVNVLIVPAECRTSVNTGRSV